MFKEITFILDELFMLPRFLLVKLGVGVCVWTGDGAQEFLCGSDDSQDDARRVDLKFQSWGSRMDTAGRVPAFRCT